MNIFEYAARNKIRFASPRGVLTVEQLFGDVPLRSTDGFNLDVIAREAKRQLTAATEESFVNTERTPAHVELETKLEIVKFVIASKLDDEAAAKQRAANKTEREQLLAILSEKQAGKLTKLSETELRRRIEALT